MCEIRVAIEQAYQGVIPTLENSLPSFVNHDFVMSIMEQIYIITLKTAFSKVQDCKSQGIIIDVRDKRFAEVEIDIENTIEVEKQEIFKKFGLLHYEDPPSLIVHKAIEKFSRESKNFSKKLREMEDNYKANVELIMKDSMSLEKFESVLHGQI